METNSNLPTLLTSPLPTKPIALPNEFPERTGRSNRLAVIVEYPTVYDFTNGRHLFDTSGRLLWGLLSRQGILREDLYIGAVCPKPLSLDDYFHPDASIETIINEGKHQLLVDLCKFKPNLCLLLGTWSLRAFHSHPRPSLDDWRGSLFMGMPTFVETGPQDRFKCLATYAPRFVLANYGDTMPLFQHDLRRASLEATTPTLTLPKRDLLVDLTPLEILYELDQILASRPTCSIDIEGYVFAMSCISIATSHNRSFIIPFKTQFWGDLEGEMWRRLAKLLYDPQIPKVLQNSLYDMFVLQYSYNLPVRGLRDDTMLKHWELYQEIPKALGVQASLYTREPHWKHERKTDDLATFHRYCCTDSAVTYEINTVLSEQLRNPGLAHYRFNMSMLEPLLYMELKGLAYAREKGQERLARLQHQSHLLQHTFDLLIGAPQRTRAEWFQLCAETFCFKREQSCIRTPDDLIRYAKKEALTKGKVQAAAKIFQQATLSYADEGQLSRLTGATINLLSPAATCEFLYETCKYPIQYKKERGRLTDDETSNTLAILTIFKQTKDPLLKLILAIRYLLTRIRSLDIELDPDGRIRCSYNVVGSETGRLTCSTSVTGSGFNLQTVTKKDRDLLCADPGYLLFQCDLSGADGWTVACHCASLGDRTMLDDYLFGLKPAKLLSLIYTKGHTALSQPRATLKALSKEVDSNGWLYFACKRVQHGSNYGMRSRTMSDQILQDSHKLLGEPTVVEPATCDALQRLYFQRYPGVLRWHTWLKQLLKTDGKLTSASGSTRIFFGRKDDYDTFKQAAAQEPQHNTTYALNTAILRLWNDRENRTAVSLSNSQAPRQRMADILETYGIRVSSPNGQQDRSEPTQESPPSGIRSCGGLLIQPLHQVHDALIGQFPIERTAWAVPRIRGYFNNPITIAGQTITIPFEGAYGPNWKELTTGVI